MIVTQKSLSRRTVLRGLGATVALPLLDAMVPALSAAARTVTAPVPRLGFFYVPNGTLPRNFHPTGTGGSGFDLTPVLSPLAPYRDQLTVVTGLSNSGVVSPNEGGGVHTRAHGGWLNGILPKRTEGADIRAGKTIDQYAADKLGTDTALRSLELTTESNYQVGNCENGYSCAYRNSTSWLTPTTPLPHERDPRVVVQRLFGDVGSVEARHRDAVDVGRPPRRVVAAVDRDAAELAPVLLRNFRCAVRAPGERGSAARAADDRVRHRFASAVLRTGHRARQQRCADCDGDAGHGGARRTAWAARPPRAAAPPRTAPGAAARPGCRPRPRGGTSNSWAWLKRAARPGSSP